MTAALVLLAFVVLASTVGRSLLLNAGWVQASPRWGIWTWQALSVSIASAVVLAAIAVAVPLLPIRSNLAQFAQITPLQLDHHYTTPGGTWIAALALTFAVGMLGRIAWLTSTSIHRAARQRRIQAQALMLVGIDHPDGYVVIEHAAPLVYCLPGRRRQVVVTSSAVSLLSTRELGLVLAHERTHLRARHDIALAMSGALARTFGPLAFFRVADQQIATLVEMQADDAARATDDRRALARALVALTVAQTNRGTSSDALARVRRLTDPTGLSLDLRRGTAVALMTVALLSTPIGLALAPAIEASASECCTDPRL